MTKLKLGMSALRFTLGGKGAGAGFLNLVRGVATRVNASG